MQLQGILTGRYIELSCELDFPDGQHVTVDIRPDTLSLKAQRRLIAATALVENTVFVTDDIKHVKYLEDLRIENWLQDSQ